MPSSLVVEDSAILKFVDVKAEQRCSPETAADVSDNRRVCCMLVRRDCLSSAGYSVDISLSAHLQGCTLPALSLRD
jgi:hypothetical protein